MRRHRQWLGLGLRFLGGFLIHLPVRILNHPCVGIGPGRLALGGIAGCFQDNGDFEKGCLLGFDESHFRFAMSATGRLTYLAAASTFQKGQWYHVVGLSHTGEPRNAGAPLTRSVPKR